MIFSMMIFYMLYNYSIYDKNLHCVWNISEKVFWFI